MPHTNKGVSKTQKAIHAKRNGKPKTRGSTLLTNGTAIVSATIGMPAKRNRIAACMSLHVMTARSAFLDERIQRYIVEKTVEEHPVLAALRAETAPMPMAGMQIGADQGRFMQFLAQTIGARRYVEVGVFTGYSALAIALALPKDGYILACDISEEYTAIARRYWREAGVKHTIDLHLAPALETLDRAVESEPGSYDLAFIDADKANVDNYYERCLKLLRVGGIIMVDNTLWDGKVADDAVDDEDTRALRALNLKVTRDPRVDAVLLSVGDGLLLARKR